MFHACFLRAASLALGVLTLLFTLLTVLWSVAVRRRGPHCVARGVLATNSQQLEEELDGGARTAVCAADFVLNVAVSTFVILGLGAAALGAVFARLRDGTVRGGNAARSRGSGGGHHASEGGRGAKRRGRHSKSQAAEAWEGTSRAILRTALRLQAARSSIALLLVCILLGACTLFAVAAVQRHSGAKVVVVHGPDVCAQGAGVGTAAIVLPMLLPFVLTVSATCVVLIAASRSDRRGANLALGAVVVVPAAFAANALFEDVAGGIVRLASLILGIAYVIHAAKPAVVNLWRLLRGRRLGRHSSRAVQPAVEADPLMAPNKHSPHELIQYCSHELEAAGKQARAGALVILILLLLAGAAASLLFPIAAPPDDAASHVILASYARSIAGSTGCLAACAALARLLLSTHRLAVEGLFSLHRTANASAACVRLRNALHLVCYQLHLPLEAVSLAHGDIAAVVDRLGEAANAVLPAPGDSGAADDARGREYEEGRTRELSQTGLLHSVTVTTGELGAPPSQTESVQPTDGGMSMRTGKSAQSSLAAAASSAPGAEAARQLLRITARAQSCLARLDDAASFLRWVLGSILTLDSLRHSGIVLTQEVVDPTALTLTLRQVTGAAAASVGARARVILEEGRCGNRAVAGPTRSLPRDGSEPPDGPTVPLLLADGKRLVQACLLLAQCTLQCANGGKRCRQLLCRVAVRPAESRPSQAPDAVERAITESLLPKAERDGAVEGGDGAEEEEEAEAVASQTWTVLDTASKSLPECRAAGSGPSGLIFSCDVECLQEGEGEGEGEGLSTSDDASSASEGSGPMHAGPIKKGGAGAAPGSGARYAPHSEPAARGADHLLDEAYFRAKTLCAIVKAHCGALRQYSGGATLELPVVRAPDGARSDAGAETTVFSAASESSEYSTSSAGSTGRNLPTAYFEREG